MLSLDIKNNCLQKHRTDFNKTNRNKRWKRSNTVASTNVKVSYEVKIK